jgi:hypothetical protein
MLQDILDGLNWLLGWLYKLLNYGLDGLLYTIKGVLYLLLSGIFTTIEVILSTISFSNVVFQWAAAYTDIPPQAVYVMTMIGFPEFVVIVSAAYYVRLLMNLVPSVAGNSVDKL